MGSFRKYKRWYLDQRGCLGIRIHISLTYVDKSVDVVADAGPSDAEHRPDRLQVADPVAAAENEPVAQVSVDLAKPGAFSVRLQAEVGHLPDAIEIVI